MDEEYRLIAAKLLEFELQGTITPEQKTVLATAISRILHNAVAKRNALEVVHIQAMQARLDKLKLIFEVPRFDVSDEGHKTWVLKSDRKVFIVHGRNEVMKQATARVIEKLGLQAVILAETANLGKVLLEKLTDNGEVGYAIILLSPDDMGYLKEEGSKKAKPRARQNVIFEMGYFLGKIGRDNIAAIYLITHEFEFPSDIEGVAYIPYDEHEGWKYRLVAELRAKGFDVDANKLL